MSGYGVNSGQIRRWSNLLAEEFTVSGRVKAMDSTSGSNAEGWVSPCFNKT